MSRGGLCTFDNCKILKVTEKGGVLVHIGKLDRDVWFFQDMIHENSEIWKEGQEGQLVVSEWVTTKKDLI